MNLLLMSNCRLQDDMKALGDQVKELHQMNRRRERLVIAAQCFAQVFDDAGLAYDEGERLNDQQMSALTALLRTAGHEVAADTWLGHHVPDSEDADPIAEALAG
ncbi:hypothetical protein ACFRJ3_34985 [Streptomyces sp. NPDC056696]|uniref:hypothetical protein n=1 Tax=Streptomyces sp. NPDC056696 TaxID=3345914 RepID=UPI0036B370D7